MSCSQKKKKITVSLDTCSMLKQKDTCFCGKHTPFVLVLLWKEMGPALASLVMPDGCV